MIKDMPRPRPSYLLRQVTRHGTVVWYVRRGRGKRTRLRAEYDTPEFWTEYNAALVGAPVTSKVKTGTVGWLIEQYRQTTAWRDLAQGTRKHREHVFLHVLEVAGHQPIAKVTQASIVASRDKRTSPDMARNFLDTMRGLFRWAKEARLVTVDPTEGVKNPARRQTSGFPAWAEEDVAKYEKRWPLGTRQRVWLDVILYTGLRRSDAVRLGKQHLDQDNVATIRTKKTGMVVIFPVLPILRETLAAGPCGELTFICGERGRPFTAESFGNEFREACRAAGVTKSAHGVRKIAATRLANNGATDKELDAIFGWAGGGMSQLYTRTAERKRLAMRAMHKLTNDSGTFCPSPTDKVRGSEPKT